MSTRTRKIVRPSLTLIFNKSDSVAYGPFRMTIDSNTPFYIDARFFVHDNEVRITPQQKEIMALLIAQKGQILTAKNLLFYVPEMGKKSGIATTLNPQISFIRKAIREQVGPILGKEEADNIAEAISSSAKRGRKAQGQKERPDLKSAYKIATTPYIDKINQKLKNARPAEEAKADRMDLMQAFGRTETLEHGIFRITRKPGEASKKARFYVQDREVKLTARENEIMALLISKQGQPVTHNQMLALDRTWQHGDKTNLMKVHLSNIKKKIANELSEYLPPEQIEGIKSCIRSRGPNKKEGQTGTQTGPRIRSYKLMMNFE